MERFKSPKSAQRFISFHAAVYNTFNVQRHLICRPAHRQFRAWRKTFGATRRLLQQEFNDAFV